MLSLLAAAAAGGAIRDIAVERDGGTYRLEVDALVHASPTEVRARLTDYRHLKQLNGSIRSSEILEREIGGACRVRIVTRACVWFFCRTIEQVQLVRESGDGNIDVRVIPELSDFKSGSARFRIRAEQSGTRLMINSEIEPAFWVPPLIGPWLIKRKLHAEMLETVANLEAPAR